MIQGRSLGAPSWFIESTKFDELLDITFEDHFGEVWLYNNDLKIFLDSEAFRELYIHRIFGSLRENIDCVKILLNPDVYSKVFGDDPDTWMRNQFIGNLHQIAQLENGPELLSRFYVGKADVKRSSAKTDSWIFYAQRGELAPNASVVMFRHRAFPFSGREHLIAIVWILRDEHVLQQRLRQKFERIFNDDGNFHWIRLSEGVDLREQLVPGWSQETQQRRQRRAGDSRFDALSFGDRPDIAIMAALPEEMAALEQVLKDAAYEVRQVSWDRRYSYFIVRNGNRARKVLLVAINDQGSVASASATVDLIRRWRPQHIILLGVAGGEPNADHGPGDEPTQPAQGLGDVVVSRIVVAYEHAKIQNGKYSRSPITYEWPNNRLYDAAAVAAKRWPKELDHPRPDGQNVPCKVHYEVEKAIASGSKLVADANFFNLEIVQKCGRGIISTEMEGWGVAHACRYTGEDGYHADMLVVKAIMDRSDLETRSANDKDRWKEFSSFAAAEFVLDLLKSLR